MTQKILRLPEVMDRTGLSRSSIYRYLQDGRFPVQVQIGKRAVGWSENSIERWIEQCVKQAQFDAV